MYRDEALIKARDLLFDENKPQEIFPSEEVNENNYMNWEKTPISPNSIANITGGKIILITEEAYKNLLKVKGITNKTNEEVAFFMYGSEYKNGIILFDEVKSTYKSLGNIPGNYVDVNAGIKGLEAEENNTNNCKKYICKGNTHKEDNLKDNFCFGDLISHVQFNHSHPVFKNREVEVVSMVITQSGDFNFLFYDNDLNMEGFYKFNDVYLKKDNKNLEELPAYKNGDYLTKAKKLNK